MFKKWDDLPEFLKNNKTKIYYNILKKKRRYLVIKRILDILFSFILIVIFSPIIILIALFIKIDSRGPVFYRQERITIYGKKFKIFKFRTMIQDADKNGKLVTTKNDSRITNIGKLIRKYRIDEIPQLFNIITGDMSFVGTRPEVEKYVKQYTDEMKATLLLPAGLTSKTSIQYKDEDNIINKYLKYENDLDKIYVNIVLKDKMKINLEYIKECNMFNDIKLCFETALKVIKKDNRDRQQSKNEKKVLFVATCDSHIKQFHLEHIKWFKDRGYEIHVATNGNEFIENCYKKHRIPIKRTPLKYSNFKAIKILKNIIDNEKFDIIHCHEPMGSVVTRLAARKSRKNGTKVIYTAHGFHFFKGAPIINWMIFYPIEKFLSKYTDCIITINNEDYVLAKKHFKCNEVEFVNGVGVNQKKFKKNLELVDKEKIRKKLGISNDEIVLMYAAELSDRKNQGMLLRVMSELLTNNKKIKLLLPGSDSKNGKYQLMANKLGVSDNILFLGYRTDIDYLIQIADILVSTSKQEGLPVNIIEGIMRGLPIVATNCRGNRDLIKNGENGFLVDLNDIEDFKLCIEKIIDDKKLCEKFKKFDMEFCKKYTSDSVMEDLKRIYIGNEENKCIINIVK